MTTPITIRSSSAPVTLTAEIDATQQLVLSCQGIPLTPENGYRVEILYTDPSMLPVAVEIQDIGIDPSRWTMTAVQGSQTWERGENRCMHRWSEPSDEIRVEVEATKSGERKSRPIYIAVQPQGVKPDL